MIKVLACNGSFFNHTVFVSSVALLSLPSDFCETSKKQTQNAAFGLCPKQVKSAVFLLYGGDGGMRSCSAESLLSGRRASQPRTLTCSVAATAWVRANNRSQKKRSFFNHTGSRYGGAHVT